jgi:uncharacterized protein (TIGR03083 family)
MNDSVIDVNLSEEVADECRTLADLLEASPSAVWDAPTLCDGWRTREVVAHMTMPARLTGPEFMAEMQVAGGDFTTMSNAVAARDGARPTAALLADLRSDALHAWEPPAGGPQGALTHCVIHGLDITESSGLGRVVPSSRIARVLTGGGDVDLAQVFGTDVGGVELIADDLSWSYGRGELVTGPAQVLALVLCGRRVPAGRLRGPASARFSRPG